MTLTPQTIKQYHVFLASPSDVNEERKMVRQFFDRYNRHIAQLWRVRFEVVDWENYATVGVGHPQELITKQTLERFRDSLALVVGLMAQRFGSPTVKAESGTEEEFRWAVESHRHTGFPEIKWFFKRVEQFVSPSDPNAVAKALEQWKKVHAFQEELQNLHVFYAEYPDVPGFRDTFENDLNHWLTDRARPWVPTIEAEDSRLLPMISPPRAYYESIERDFHRLDIAGIDNDRAFEIPLSDIYVRLRVMFDEESETETDKVRDTGPIDVQTALLRYPKLVIVGDPGSGKSTFLKYVALMLARSFSANNPGIALEKLCLQEPLPIPVFVSCWDLSDFLKKSDTTQLTMLLEFLEERLAAYGFLVQRKDFETLLADGNCCLLFDGLDEVPTDKGRVAVSRLLEDCVKKFPKNRYVVTSRVRAYTGDTILKGEFNRCDIQPLDASDRVQFLKNWVALLFKISLEQVLEEGTEGNREFQSLTKGVETNDRICPLAVNPLLLTVIAIVHWNRKRLPEQRGALYDECVDVLLGQRKEAEHIQLGRKTGTFDEHHELEQREERAWVRKRFAEIALHILSGEGNRDEATRAELIKLLAPRFIDRGASSQEQAEVRATYFLDRQELHSGLLVSRREQSYRFVHLTFQEYLAAWHLANQEFDQVAPIVEPRLRQQPWFEALQLLGGEWAKQSDEKLDRYLAWLLERQGKSIAERAPVIALCANIVKDSTGVAELKPETRKKFKAGIEGTLDAFRPGSGIPALTQLEILEALGQLGAGVKSHLTDATKSGLFQVRRRAIEMLLPHCSDDDLFQMDHILSDRSKEPIKTYLLSLFGRDAQRATAFLQGRQRFSEKATEAFVEIYPALTPMLDRSVLVETAKRFFYVGRSLYTYTYWYPDAASRGRLLGYIGEESLIRTAATGDTEGLVRLCALKYLVKLEKTDGQDWPVVREAAIKDKNAGVRRGALELLVEGHKDAPETWPVVREAAIKDKDASVRIRALELLAEGHKDAPETWPLIREGATEDKDADVRAIALELLVQGQKDAPETWPLVRVAAIKDKHFGVRRRALAALVREQKDATGVKLLFTELISSINDSDSRRDVFFVFTAKILGDPVERQLLSDVDRLLRLDLVPDKLVTLARVKQASSLLGRTEAEVRKLYEELVDVLSAKLELDIKLEWRIAPEIPGT